MKCWVFIFIFSFSSSLWAEQNPAEVFSFIEHLAPQLLIDADPNMQEMLNQGTLWDQNQVESSTLYGLEEKDSDLSTFAKGGPQTLF